MEMEPVNSGEYTYSFMYLKGLENKFYFATEEL